MIIGKCYFRLSTEPIMSNSLVVCLWLRIVWLCTVFGCTDPGRQAGAVYTRKKPDVLTVTCNASGFEYQLQCTGNEWVGQRYNCSDIGKPHYDFCISQSTK